MGAARVVEVVVRAIVVDPIGLDCCFCIRGGGPLHDGVGAIGVTRGAHYS